MLKNAKFEKISFEEFKKGYEKKHPSLKPDAMEEKARKLYEEIKLPRRATKGSAGYDFFLVEDLEIPGGSITDALMTGIRCKMRDDIVLMLYPRSGLGLKYGLSLINTTGVIDSDYYGAKNEGHIMLKLKNPSKETIKLKKDDAIMQGVFLPFFVTDDDNTNGERTGGFGSTSQNS